MNEEIVNTIFYRDSKLEKSVDELVDELAKKAAEEKMFQQGPNALQGFSELLSQFKRKYQKEFIMKSLGDSLVQAVEVILEEGPHDLSEKEWEQVSKGIVNHIELIKDESPSQEKNFQEFLSLNKENLHLIEKIANRQYFDHHYPASIAIYIFLSQLDPQNFHYYQRLGIVYQSSHLLKEAIQAYDSALQLNPDDLPTHLFLSECFCLLEQKTQAQEEWEKIQALRATAHDPVWDNYSKALEMAIFG